MRQFLHANKAVIKCKCRKKSPLMMDMYKVVCEGDGGRLGERVSLGWEQGCMNVCIYE